MTTPTITDYLKYANLQMAAEAFIRNENTGVFADSGQLLIDALKVGNNHSSKFTATEAARFADPVEGWTVIDQRANTGTGFSGTLFKSNKTGELVISFRSTEFIDDAVRDNLATNTYEIKNTGFAWGQIADMEAWYADLSKTGGPLDGKSYAVTGYSLGGHLATVFNLLRHEEASLGPVNATLTEVVTFNGAGVGVIKPGQGSLTSAVSYFTGLLKTPAQIEATLGDDSLRTTYRSIRSGLASGVMNIAGAKDALASLSFSTNTYTEFQIADLNARKLEVWRALDEIAEMQSEAARLQTIRKGGEGDGKDERPQDVPISQIQSATLDYRMAVMLAAKNSSAASLLEGASRAVNGKEYLTQLLSNQYDVVGDTSPSAVANSQWHAGKDVRIFIEDQPIVRGGIVSDALGSFLDYGSIKLLVDGYALKDFGDTHSLVLLVDSLNLQNTLQQLAPNTTTETLNAILKAASNLKRVDGATFFGADQGKAEGDVLENTLNALGTLLLGPETWKSLHGDPEGNTWARIEDAYRDGGEEGMVAFAGRDSFYKNLDDLLKSGVFTALKGQLSLSVPVSATIKDSARTDFSAFAALYALSPFQASLQSGSLEDAVKGAWGKAYTDWDNDRRLSEADLAAGKAMFSEKWYTDRSAFLNYWLQSTAQNVQILAGVGDSGLVNNTDQLVFKQMDTGQKITVMPDSLTGGQPPTDKESQYVLFGGKVLDILTGGKLDDHLYGMSGLDVLSGGKGSDYMEGGTGLDFYRFKEGDGQDTIQEDTEQRGLLQRSNELLTLAYQRAPGQWAGQQGTDAFTATRDGTSLVLTFEGSEDSITLKNFDFDAAKSGAGSDGLRLIDPLAAAPSPVRSFIGDTQDLDKDGNPANGIQPNRVVTYTQLLAKGFDLNGTAAEDVIKGSGINDRIDAGDSNDLVMAGGGNNQINGGAGNDWAFGGGGDDGLPLVAVQQISNDSNWRQAA